MEKFSSKLLPILFVYWAIITLIDCADPKIVIIPANPNICQINNNAPSMDTTIMADTNNLKVGDKIDCSVVNVTSIAVPHNTCLGPFYTQAANDPSKYVFVPVSNTTNCFSFQVKADKGAQILLSNTATVGDKFEIIIDKAGKVVIRNKSSQEVAVSIITDADIINATDLRPFWIRYVNGLVEVGKGTDSAPLVSYQVKSTDGFPASVNYVGFQSNGVPGEWLVDSNPICGVRAKPKWEMKTVCKIRI